MAAFHGFGASSSIGMIFYIIFEDFAADGTFDIAFVGGFGHHAVEENAAEEMIRGDHVFKLVMLLFSFAIF